MVRFGQCAYSALITIGFEETEVFVFFKSASVLDFIISAIADAETTGLPYSSESSSCFQCHIQIETLKYKPHAHKSIIISLTDNPNL